MLRPDPLYLVAFLSVETINRSTEHFSVLVILAMMIRRVENSDHSSTVVTSVGCHQHKRVDAKPRHRCIEHHQIVRDPPVRM
jgi:hypothetical protein